MPELEDLYQRYARDVYRFARLTLSRTRIGHGGSMPRDYFLAAPLYFHRPT